MFPRLPLLRLIERCAASIDFSGTSITAVQHLLTETGCLLQSICRMGVRPDALSVLGKPYSSNAAVGVRLHRLGISSNIPCGVWPTGRYGVFFSKAIKDLLDESQVHRQLNPGHLEIVLDDGGSCMRLALRRKPQTGKTIGIEQTTSGLKSIAQAVLNFPVIAVATSAAKRFIEPPIVLRAAVNKSKRRLGDLRHTHRIGVIGLGNIGSHIAAGVRKMGTRLCVYDKCDKTLSAFIEAFPSSVRCSSACDVVAQSNLVFGCTGVDALPRRHWTNLGSGHKTLVSCSSSEVEFLSLLRSGLGTPKNAFDPFSAIDYHWNNLSLTILEGGFPITFDREAVSAPVKDMQMTRGLLLGAIIQAVVCADQQRTPGARHIEMLHPAIQAFVVRHWLRLNPLRRKDYANSVIAGFQDEAWIRNNSEGTFVESNRLRDIFRDALT